MDELKQNKSIEICSNMLDIAVTQHQSEVGVHIRNGAILLCVTTSPFDDDEDRFRFCIGWPKDNGDIPKWFKDITS